MEFVDVHLKYSLDVKTIMDTRKPLVDYKEEDIVQHMVAEPDFWNPFHAIDGIPEGAKCLTAVQLEPILKAKGDVDVLVVDPARPEEASAFQVKRIKINDSSFDTGLPNGLGKLTKLHRQSELLIKLRFWRVFSVALVVVDGQQQATETNRYTRLTPSLEQAIAASVMTTDLNSELGFIRMDYFQSFPGSPLHSGSSAINLLRNATARKQPSNVTLWVKHALKKHS